MFDRSVRSVFDEAAEAYDIARPGYPSELIDRLIELTRLPANARILEIGCGTGQITVPLAECGYEIVAIELGENLAAVAARNLSGFPHARVIHSTLEEWRCDEPAFDLVVSAQAFHWLDPVIGYPKIRQLLQHSGHLAVIYNLFSGGDDLVYRDLESAYRRHSPQRDENDALRRLQETVERTVCAISDCRLFHEPVVWEHDWIEIYTADRYMKLLETFSDHRSLPEPNRTHLFRDIRRIIDKHGGSIDRPLQATLFLSRVL